MTINDRRAQKSILIVDDAPANLQLLATMLRRQGYKVRIASSGAHALQSVRASLPDLILLDIMMPGLDGYETCRQLKAEPMSRDIPVIFATALDTMQDKVRAFKAGGVDYVTKPFQMEEIIARVETHLALREMQQQLEEQNDQLRQEITERQVANASLVALNEVAFAVNHSLDLEADLENGLKIILRELKLEWAWLFIPEEDNELLRLVVSLGLPDAFRRQESLTPVDRCACHEVMTTGQHHCHFRPVCQRLEPYRVERPDLPDGHLAVPIVTKQKVVGILNLAGAEMARLSGAQYEWLEMVAGQIGGAIGNGLLYQNVLNKAERLTIINRLSTIISQFWQLERVLPPLLSEVARVLNMNLGLIVLPTESSQARFKTYLQVGPWQSTGDELKSLAWHELPLFKIIEQTRSPLLVAEPGQDERLKPLAGLIERENIRTMLVLPLKAQGQLAGFIQLFATDQKRTLEAAELELALTLTNQAAIAVEKARLYQETVSRYEQEVEMARQIQQNLLPQMVPDLAGVRLAGVCRPAFMTGGDFYDYVLLPDQRLGIVVGDVTGKSLPAALVMALARNTLRSELVNHGQPAAAMTAANRWLCRDIKRGTFVATVQALVDVAAHRMWLVNAGQVAALLVRDQEVTYLLPAEAASLPLGLQPEISYGQAEIRLEAGDLLFFYTDGLVEAKNNAGEMFGFERLEAAARRLQAEPGPQQIMDGLLAEVQAFMGQVEQHDDITLVVMQV